MLIRKTLALLAVCFAFPVFGEFSLEELLGLQRSESGRLSCEELTDKFCESLWSAENQGNFRFPDGTQILTGTRRKNFMENGRFIHLQKTAKSRCLLPDDVKDTMGIHCGDGDQKTDMLARLEALLSRIDSIDQNKKSMSSWQRSIDQILSDFGHAIDDTAYESAAKDRPDIKERLWDDWTFHEKKALYENYYDIKTEIMKAVYLNDSDWQRVVKVFNEAVQDVLTVVEQMDLDAESENIMKEKVSSVKLSLPYEDPRRVGSVTEFCATSENNAYYIHTSNAFVICMGKINGSLNEGALYGTIAHEIAHSIDPTRFLADVYTQTPESLLLKELYEGSASLPCDDWEQRKGEAFSISSETYELPEKLSSLDQCLIDRRGLSEINHSALDYVSDRFAEMSMDSPAQQNHFSLLTTDKVFKDGVLEDNEFYLEPKLFEESKNFYMEVSFFHKGYFHDMSVFVKEYKCRILESRSEKEAFAEALEETKKLRKMYEYYLSDLLGQNSKGLVMFNLSKPSAEDFADWISYKAMELKLKRNQSVESRRAFLLADTSFFCKPKSLETLAKEKTLIERQYSRAFHPPDRNRRLSRFTPKIADLLECVRGEDILKLDKNCDSL